MFQVENLKFTVYLIMKHLYGSAVGSGDVTFLHAFKARH